MSASVDNTVTVWKYPFHFLKEIVNMDGLKAASSEQCLAEIVSHDGK
jgi:hypothetical protein